MKRLSPILATFVLAAAGACTAAAPDARTPRAVLSQAEATITANDIYRRIAFLASDELRGRDTPSPGLDSAAAFIVREFEAMGLRPGAHGDWIQPWPYPLEGLDPRRARFEISAGATHGLEYGTEFFAQVGATPEGRVGVVYLGDPEHLARVSTDAIRDRAVLLRLDAAAQPARGGLRFDGQTRARIQQATRRAADAGAATVVFVLDERMTRGEVIALAETAAEPARAMGGRADRLPPATFYISRPAAVRLFRMAGLDGPEQLRRQVDAPVPLPGASLHLDAPLRRLDDVHAPNVVGVLRGSDPALRDSYIVISAHFDHVGVGAPDARGDSIYNGADDNASGTAALMGIAGAFAALPTPPARSVLFLAVSGEEKGLLGSRWFADHPTVPIESIVANINLDMIGRNSPDSIVVIGKEYSSLGPLVLEVAERNAHLGLTVSRDLWPQQRFFFRSDHFSFAAREIPALFFFAGVHEDYHRPSDEVHKIDFYKTMRVARLAFHLAHRIAEDREPPAWDPQGLEEVRALVRGRATD